MAEETQAKRQFYATDRGARAALNKIADALEGLSGLPSGEAEKVRVAIAAVREMGGA